MAANSTKPHHNHKGTVDLQLTLFSKKLYVSAQIHKHVYQFVEKQGTYIWTWWGFLSKDYHFHLYDQRLMNSHHNHMYVHANVGLA